MDWGAPVKYGAIEACRVTYKGHEFDSATEANVARAFDERGIKWEPQPGPFPDRGFIFGDRYTPDFYLPELGVYVEVCSTWDERHEHVCCYFNANYAPIWVIDQQGFVCDWMGRRRKDNPLGADSLLPYNPHSDYEELFEQGRRRKLFDKGGMTHLQNRVNQYMQVLDAICRISRDESIQVSLKETQHFQMVCTRHGHEGKRKAVFYPKSGTITNCSPLSGVDDLLAVLYCESDAELKELIDQRSQQ